MRTMLKGHSGSHGRVPMVRGSAIKPCTGYRLLWSLTARSGRHFRAYIPTHEDLIANPNDSPRGDTISPPTRTLLTWHWAWCWPLALVPRRSPLTPWPWCTATTPSLSPAEVPPHVVLVLAPSLQPLTLLLPSNTKTSSHTNPNPDSSSRSWNRSSKVTQHTQIAVEM